MYDVQRKFYFVLFLIESSQNLIHLQHQKYSNVYASIVYYLDIDKWNFFGVYFQS